MAELGVCYYPEHWPEDIWPTDAARMAELGLSQVRIGEFAWSRLEPEPGNLQFDWLERAMDVLAGAGLKIILGTPTATPPKWLVDRMPDMLPVDADGHVRGFGSRRHYCFSHEGYRHECARIVTALAKRLGEHPALVAWQTDNEYGCHHTSLSWSKPARAAFRDWLAQKYQSPEALNRAWGNVFWSMEYRDFSEIELPNATVTAPNPAHLMDFRRFTSDQIVRFNDLQVDIIRRYSPGRISFTIIWAGCSTSITSTSAPILILRPGIPTRWDFWKIAATARRNGNAALPMPAIRIFSPSITIFIAPSARAAGG